MNIKFIIILILFVSFTSYVQSNKIKIKETFDVVSSNIYTYFEAPYKTQPIIQSECCLIEKKYLPDNSINGGDFKYTFNKMKNEKCDINQYNMGGNKELKIVGENNWNNINCSTDNIIGSCHNANKECIDFVEKEFCDKYKMTWTNKTCQQPLDYKWIDNIQVVLPEKKFNDSFRLF